MASRKVTDLSVAMQALTREFVAKCAFESLDIVIICTSRGDAEQDAAYACGASKCRAGQSAHNAVDIMRKPASEAFDVGVIRNGKYIANGSDPDYLRAGEIGESLGLVWGGRWKSIKDVPHFQNPDWKKQ